MNKFNLSAIIIAILAIMACNGQIANKSKGPNGECLKLNDSALRYFALTHDPENALKIINQAIKCDSLNKSFIWNKCSFLSAAGKPLDLLKYVQQNENMLPKSYYLGTLTECYFYLKDTVNFYKLKSELLVEVANEFDQYKDENTFTLYLIALKKYVGETKMLQVMDANKKLFKTKESQDFLKDFLRKKIITLKL
jgi:hypothetical protein